MSEKLKCYLCNSEDYTVIEKIWEKPPLETDYKILSKDYYREICKCNNCGVFFNKHRLLNQSLYASDYNNSISLGTLHQRFNKIINLPFDKSDNKSRVKRVADFFIKKGAILKNKKVLDIGSGTCVFLYEMRKLKFETHCIDPDITAVKHAKKNIGVKEAYHGYINEFSTKNRYDLITLNKVLEHVKEPVSILQKIKQFLTKDGVIYLELPNGTPVVEMSKIFERSEFFVEHFTIFNESSIRKLAEITNLSVLMIKEIIEPSGKYTIFAFLKPKTK